METCARGERWGLVGARRGELELVAKAGAHSVVARSRTAVAAVAVKPTMI